MRRIGWLVIAALCLVAPGFAQDDKLDPDADSGGAPPFNENALETYSPSMLVAFLEVYRNSPGAAAAATAAKIANYLSKIDPNWRRPDPPAPPTSGTTTQPRSRFRSRNERRPAGGSSGSATGSGTGTATATPPSADDDPPASTTPPRPTTAPETPPEATPVPTPTERARTEPDPTPAPTTTARAVPRSPWFREAQDQMREYWVADTGSAGALPRGSIYDPRTGKVVKLEEYIQQNGLAEGVDAELVNSGSGMGSQKRIKDQ